MLETIIIDIFLNLLFIGAFYHDADKNLINDSLGVAILYHKSSDSGIGDWEYSMPNKPLRFRKIPDEIGWPKDQPFPEVCLERYKNVQDLPVLTNN